MIITQNMYFTIDKLYIDPSSGSLIGLICISIQQDAFDLTVNISNYQDPKIVINK